MKQMTFKNLREITREERVKAKGEGGSRGGDGQIASLTQWT